MKSTLFWTASLLLCALACRADEGAVAGANDAAVGDARRVFNEKCAGCHGNDGRAKTFRAVFNKARDLTVAAWQDSVSDAAIVASIKAGRGKMPPFGEQLTEAQIEALRGYVRELKK